jgi:hypothetical protein
MAMAATAGSQSSWVGNRGRGTNRGRGNQGGRFQSYNRGGFNQGGFSQGNSNNGGGNFSNYNTNSQNPQNPQSSPYSTSRPTCQICYKPGHAAIDCYQRMNYAYQGRHPLGFLIQGPPITLLQI